jgi:hypothetical protein
MTKPAFAKRDIRGLFAAFACGDDWELGKNTDSVTELI